MKHKPNSAAFTLLEMLLVLAILAAVAALTYPAMDRIYRAHQLKETANGLRARLAATRLHAIEDGIQYQLRFEPGGRHLLVIPNDANEMRFEATSQRRSRRDSKPANWSLHVELPGGLSFGAAEETTEQLTYDELQPYSVGRALSRVSWASPILFSPTGRATPAEIEVRNSEGSAVRLSIRGLTGAATVSRVQRVKPDMRGRNRTPP